MSALPSPELLGSVRTMVEARLGAGSGYDGELVAVLCNEAITFSWILSRNLTQGHVGQRARSAAALLLELTFPQLGAGLRHQLAVGCEIIATGAHPV